jgi:signal transduction histidine kinase
VQSIVEAQATFAANYDVRCIYFQPKRTTMVKLDPERFTQALVNLLSNATKFSAAGDEVIVRVQRRGDDFVRISVHDHGPGVPKAFREKIFGKFAQADSSATRIQGGSGLGLNITRAIIEAFGGTVGFMSREGKGATFFIDLPMGARLEAAA